MCELEMPCGEICERHNTVSKVSGCGCDAVRDQSKTGQGPVTTTPPGADESRTNIHTNSPPKVGDPHSERLTWAKELIRRAKYGWPEGGGS